MRRIFIALAPAIAIALALAAPGIAFGYGAHHHGRHHKHHHARGARIVNLTPVKGSEGTGSAATESIGTVSSYEKEVLTIKLTDGSLLSGKVTAGTRVICVSSAPTEGSNDGSGLADGGHSWRGGWHHGGSCAEPSSEEGGAQPASSGGSGSGWTGSGRGPSFGRGGHGARGDCAQGAPEVDLEKVLVAGATVNEAELRITPAGAVWESVVISR